MQKLFFLLSIFLSAATLGAQLKAPVASPRAKISQKAYLTDFIQELVDIGIKVHCVIIESGWKEIDTVEDYKKAIAGFNKKFTNK